MRFNLQTLKNKKQKHLKVSLHPHKTASKPLLCLLFYLLKEKFYFNQWRGSSFQQAGPRSWEDYVTSEVRAGPSVFPCIIMPTALPITFNF